MSWKSASYILVSVDFGWGKGRPGIRAPKFFVKQDEAMELSSKVVGPPRYRDQYINNVSLRVYTLSLCILTYRLACMPTESCFLS